ncbi:MAG: hypothetical protein Crog4KO_06740 [Crocinitomicaceae bacterium]
MELEHLNTPRSNGTRVSSEPYSIQGVERIKRLLWNFKENGESKFYAILVDGEMVVPKTDNPDIFDSHSDFVNDLSREVLVRLYYGNSPNCNTYKFVISNAAPIAGISSLKDDDRIATALDSQAKDMKIVQLKEKVKRLKRKNIKLKLSLEENASVFNKNNMQGFKEYLGPAIGSLIQGFKAQGTPNNTSPMSGVENGAQVEMEPSIDSENLDMIQAMEEQYGAQKTKQIIKFVIRLARHEDLIGEVSEALHEREARPKKSNNE